MLHAREDYARIQDPASNKDLVLAYDAAMSLVARFPRAALNEANAHLYGVAAMHALEKLTRQLTPTLGLIVDSVGVHMPSNPIADDEPVFLLRGQDVYAPDTIRRWASLTYQRGHGNAEASELARAHADLIETWQVRTGKVKVADLPEQSMARTAAESGG